MFKKTHPSSSVDPAVGPASAPSVDLRPSSLRDRLRAAGIHLLISATVAASVLTFVLLLWYPGPLSRISGVGAILGLLLSVDVVLGPVLTLLVFDRRKRSLRVDLAVIACVQLAALAYGLVSLEKGRPHYLVFAKDRIEAVSLADLRATDIAAAQDNSVASRYWTGPRTVAAGLARGQEERNALLFEAVSGGRDIQHFPARYRELVDQRQELLLALRDVNGLMALNPGREQDVDRALARTGQNAAGLGFLPLHGANGDAVVLFSRKDAEPMGLADLSPW